MDRDLICEKIDYAAFLKLSVGLVTKSVHGLINKVMSSCFGTKEDCEKMAELIDLMRNVDESDKSDYKSKIEMLADECMCARNDVQVNEDYIVKKFDKSFYWFKACQVILRKHRYPKCDELEESLKNWETIACLDLIIHAKVMNTKGECIFKSLFINRCNEEKAEYDFIELSKQLKLIGSSDHLQGIEFDENVKVILSFLSELKKWYKACYKSEESQQWKDAHSAWTEIKRLYDGILHEKAAHLQDVYIQLNELNNSTSFYILITTPLPESLTKSNLECLSNVPWCCAINYGPHLKPKVFVNEQLQELKVHVARKLVSAHTDFLEFLTSEVSDVIDQQEKVYKFLENYLKSMVDGLKIKNKHINVVLLCFGQYAIDDSKHLLSSFHERLKNLYSFLVKIDIKTTKQYNVFFFTDRVGPFHGIHPCYHIPLMEFCNHLYGENCGVSNYTKPMILPSCNGNLLIEGKPTISKEPIDTSMPYLIKDFEVVHKYVDKAELKFLLGTKFNQTDVSQQELTQNIIEDLTIRFLRGSCISWVGLSEPYQLDIKRKFTEEIKRKLKSLKNTTTYFQLYHEAGAGASTLARRVLYDLREKFVCLVLRGDYKYSDRTVQCLKILYDKLKCTFLLLVDEDLLQHNIKQFFSEIQSSSISCILFKVTRVPSVFESTSRYLFPYILTSHLNESEEKSFKKKYNCYLKSTLMTEKTVHRFNVQTFQLVQKSVIPSKFHFNHCQGKHGEDGIITDQFDEDFIQVKWEGMTEKCSVNDIQIVNHNKTSQSFMFSGAFYLLKDFKDEIYKYISSKLDEPIKNCPDKIKFLAYMCLLFIYYPNQLDLQLYFGEWKDLKSQIPKEAYEFVFVDSCQHLKLVHNAVAKNILKLYLKVSGYSLLQVLINFLTENVVKVTVISTLLWERQYVVCQKRVIKQSFSHLIESLSTDYSEDKEEVLVTISKFFNDFNSLSSLARYYSNEKKFTLAKKTMEAALKTSEMEKTANTDPELVVGYTQLGDIYRHELHCQQFKNDNDCVSCEEGKKLCIKAVEMYKKAKTYVTLLQNQEYQIFGELKVRLDYLLFMKAKFTTSTATKDLCKYLVSDKTAKEMVENCHKLFDLLDKSFLHGNMDVSTTDIMKTQKRFYKLIGESLCQEFIKSIEVLLKKPDSELGIKRRYVVIHLAMVNNEVTYLSKKKGLKLINYLEYLFNEEGYKTDTILQWLICVCGVSSKYSSIENVLLVLDQWSKHVQYADALVLLYFYASYFVAALKCKASQKVKFQRYMQGYKNRLNECKEEDLGNKSLWLLRDESEACKLSKKKPKLSFLEVFEGNVIISDDFPGSQIIVFSDFYKRFKYKLHTLPIDMRNEIEVDDIVNFSVEFTCEGIKAIDIKLIKRSRTYVRNLRSKGTIVNTQAETAAGTYYC